MVACFSAPLSTQSASTGSSSSSSIVSGRPGRRRCRAAYAVIRDGGGGGGGDQSRVMTACPGNARRTVFQLRGKHAEISIVGSKTLISSAALLFRFDGRYRHSNNIITKL